MLNNLKSIIKEFNREKYIKKELNILINELSLNDSIYKKHDELKEYIEANEYGIAWDWLIDIIHTNNIQISSENYDKIKEIAQLMKYSEDKYSFLINFVS